METWGQKWICHSGKEINQAAAWKLHVGTVPSLATFAPEKAEQQQ